MDDEGKTETKFEENCMKLPRVNFIFVVPCVVIIG